MMAVEFGKLKKKFLYSVEFLNIDWGDAKSRNPDDFSIYGLFVKDWDKDTYKSINDNLYHLLIDTKLFFLESI